MTSFESSELRELDRRGLISNLTHPEQLDEMLADGKNFAVYAGFDATADSLHVGHLLPLLVLKVFQTHGHTVIPVVGTATAMVGDPSGRSATRRALERETVLENAAGVAHCIAMILRGSRPVTVEPNHKWLESQNPIEFLTDVAARVGAGRLLSLETFSRRLKDNQPLTVLELMYPLLQAADFAHIAERADGDGLDGVLQVGGSDQWGNISIGLGIAGSAVPDFPVMGLSTPLMTKADGSKMGKTAGGAVWLSGGKLSHADFFGFWRNIEDGKTEEIARFFDLLRSPMPADDKGINGLKETIAIHVTDLARGQGCGAIEAGRARNVFTEGGIDGLPEVALQPAELKDLPLVLVKVGLAGSKSQARSLISQGGVRIWDTKLDAGTLALPEDVFAAGPARLSVGRKRHVVIYPAT